MANPFVQIVFGVPGADSATLSSFDNRFATLSFGVQKHVQAGILSHTRQKYPEFITTISKHNYRAHRFIRHNGDEVIRFCCECLQVLTAYLTRIQCIIASLVVSQVRIANNAVVELQRHDCLLLVHTQV
jgi:hypothetical protein